MEMMQVWNGDWLITAKLFPNANLWIHRVRLSDGQPINNQEFRRNFTVTYYSQWDAYST